MKYFILSILSVVFCGQSIANEPGLSKVMKQNKGNILFPADVVKIPAAWDGLPLSFEYVRNWRNLLDKKVKAKNVLLLSKVEGEKYYFDFSQNGTQYPNPVYIYINGIEHKSYNGKPESNSEIYGECKFVIGECTYSITKTPNRTITTKFEAGKWVRAYTGHGGSPARSVTVYDKLGLELYRYYEAKNSVMAMKHISVREM